MAFPAHFVLKADYGKVIEALHPQTSCLGDLLHYIYIFPNKVDSENHYKALDAPDSNFQHTMHKHPQARQEGSN